MRGLSLVELPKHLLADILQFLPDAPALAAATSTHSALRSAFQEHHRLILEAVVANEVTTELFAFALTADESRRTYFAFAPAVDLLEELHRKASPLHPPGTYPSQLGHLTVAKAL